MSDINVQFWNECAAGNIDQVEKLLKNTNLDLNFKSGIFFLFFHIECFDILFNFFEIR